MDYNRKRYSLSVAQGIPLQFIDDYDDEELENIIQFINESAKTGTGDPVIKKPTQVQLDMAKKLRKRMRG